MKVAFYTLGCKVNQYETEALKEQFAARGHEITGTDDFAQVYIINTCTVTGLADRKSRQYIRRMKKKNPDSVVAVTGCYAQVSPDEVSSIEGVNIVAGTNEKGRLPEYIEAYMKNLEKSEDGLPAQRYIKEYEELEDYEETGIITSMESRSRAYIKIQEGCNRFCSYCIIPYARGRVRSRNPRDVMSEAKALIDGGFKEIILTGINTALYGTEEGFLRNAAEEPEELYGVELIIKRLNDLPGDFRIRLSSLEPTVVNAEYVKRLLKYERLCPHLHLSLQSGSDSILKAMNRRYGQREYLEIVDVLKGHDCGFGITTDIIAGFPGETEEDFKESLKVIERAGLCRVHAFKYSKRKGTAAAAMSGHISPEIKNKRVKILMEAGEKAGREFCGHLAGTVRTVLFEEEDSKNGMLAGYADNYVKVYAEKPSEGFVWQNSFHKVLFTESFADGVKGKIQEI